MNFLIVIMASGIARDRIHTTTTTTELRKMTAIHNGDRTEWSTIQGVIGRFEIKIMITPELYDKFLLLINQNYMKIREEYDSGINYLTG